MTDWVEEAKRKIDALENKGHEYKGRAIQKKKDSQQEP
jgi:hypothetical protein